MHPETFLRVLDWFLHDASGEETDVQLGFFGGEPLINKRLLRQMIKTAAEKAQRCGKHLKISVNTNGILLNESILDFFECHNIMLHVSIDGCPETHNRHRKTFNGHGSYNLVAPSLNRLVSLGENVQISGTTNPDTVHSMHKEVSFLIGLGFKKIKLVPNMLTYWSTEESQTYEHELRKVADDYVNSRLDSGRPHFSMAVLDGFINKRIQQATEIFPSHTPTCGAGKTMLGISMDGGIYPCVSFTGYRHDSFRLGDVFHGIAHPDLYAMFSEKTAMANTSCARCSLFAGGCGCYFLNVQITGNIHRPAQVFCGLVGRAALVANTVFDRLYTSHYCHLIREKINSVERLLYVT